MTYITPHKAGHKKTNILHITSVDFGYQIPQSPNKNTQPNKLPTQNITKPRDIAKVPKHILSHCISNMSLIWTTCCWFPWIEYSWYTCKSSVTRIETFHFKAYKIFTAKEAAFSITLGKYQQIVRRPESTIYPAVQYLLWQLIPKIKEIN